MFQLKELLSRFKEIKDPRQIKVQIAALLNQELSLDLFKPENVTIERNIIKITAHPALRQKIFTSKEKIIETMKKHLPDEFIVDIR